MQPKPAKENDRVDRDRKAKWAIGCQEHGPVMHEDPLAGLYSECLDGINYTEALLCDESLRPEHDILRLASANMRRTAKIVLFVQNMHPDRKYQPQAAQFK